MRTLPFKRGVIMRTHWRLLVRAIGAAAMLGVFVTGGRAADKELIPRQLPKEQQEKLARFLQAHEKPKTFMPPDAKVVGSQTGNVEAPPEAAKDKPVKQYLVQITSHRPVPGQEQVTKADVYYYRPNPEKGKRGITVKHTVDLTTGEQVGQTEVILNGRAPLAREELTEAVELAKEKSAAVQELYKGREKNAVHWEYLQLMIQRKTEAHEPGDRAVTLVFRVSTDKEEAPPAPVRVVVNLTKGVVTPGPK